LHASRKVDPVIGRYTFKEEKFSREKRDSNLRRTTKGRSPTSSLVPFFESVEEWSKKVRYGGVLGRRKMKGENGGAHGLRKKARGQ